jgi:hypothetical protein
MRWAVQDRKGVRGSAAAAPGSRIDGEWFLRGEFPLGVPGYGLRGVGSLGGSVPLGSRICCLFWCPVALRVACLTYFLLRIRQAYWEVDMGTYMYALRLGVQFLAKDTGNYAPVNIFVYFSDNSSTKDFLSCLVIQLCKLRSNVSFFLLTTICNTCRD